MKYINYLKNNKTSKCVRTLFETLYVSVYSKNFSESSAFELHAFFDVSTNAYAAVVYSNTLNVITAILVGAKNQNFYHQYSNITQFRTLLSPSVIRSHLFGTRYIDRHCLWNILSDRFYNCVQLILKLQPKVIKLCSM